MILPERNITGKGDWMAFYCGDELEIQKEGSKFVLYDGEVTDAILPSEEGLYYGRNGSLCLFDFATESEKTITSGWNNVSPAAKIDDYMYFYASLPQDAGAGFLVEVNLKSGETRQFDFPEFGSIIVCGGEIYYTANRYEKCAVPLYKADLKKGTAEIVDTAVGLNVMANKGKLYYCQAAEKGAFLDNEAQISVVEFDTKTGKTRELTSGTYGEIGEPVETGTESIYFLTQKYQETNQFYKSSCKKWKPDVIIEGASLSYIHRSAGALYVLESYYDSFRIKRCEIEEGKVKISESELMDGLFLGLYGPIYYHSFFDENDQYRYHYDKLWLHEVTE